MLLTPRDRLRTALARREPDRPPFDLGSTQVTSIASRTQRRLRTRLGLADTAVRVSDRVQQLDHVEDEAALARIAAEVADFARAFPMHVGVKVPVG